MPPVYTDGISHNLRGAKMGKMWAGRFKGALDKQADDFNSSFHFDNRMSVSYTHLDVYKRQI